LRKRIDEETAAHGPFALIIIDTSAAFFEGDDENSRTQLGNHARNMRTFVNISGGPTVLVTCHPVKNADRENLLPAGGGSFLNEVDGNLVCIKQPDSPIVELHWHGKLRGPDFEPIPFKLTPGKSDLIKDSKGRQIWTITAAPVTKEEQTQEEGTQRGHQDKLLAFMANNPGLTMRDLADKLGWVYANGKPNQSLVQRVMASLKKDKLVEKKRGRWTLTKSGKKAASEEVF
jgi:hypothetical protein